MPLILLLFSIFILTVTATNNNPTPAPTTPSRNITVTGGFSAHFPVSIVSAEPHDATTLAVNACEVQNCTAKDGSLNLAGLAQVTLSLSRYEANYNLTASLNNSSPWTFSGSSACELYETSGTIASKVCTGGVVAWNSDSTTETYVADVATITDRARLGVEQIVVTGGVDKLPAVSVEHESAATTASVSSSGVAVASAVVEVVKMVVPAGAVGIVGAGLLV